MCCVGNLRSGLPRLRRKQEYTGSNPVFPTRHILHIGMSYVNVKCVNCGKDFEKQLRNFNESKKRGWNHFCGMDCLRKFQTLEVEVPCGKCDAPVRRDPSDIKGSKSGLVFCNKSCAVSYNNTVCRRGEDHPNFKRAEEAGSNNSNHYRLICFTYHEKKCVVCDERVIVEAHHLDGNHDNNDPSNLIPLCPTHHKYWHSRHRSLIEAKVLEYREQFLEAAPLVERFDDFDLESY